VPNVGPHLGKGTPTTPVAARQVAGSTAGAAGNAVGGTAAFASDGLAPVA